MEANIKQASGFTLVEISIVMIIIGLLIGGTFGGMKLIENMQVNRTVQDLKAIESAALTFKDTYGRLPGDIVSPATRLANCTVAPCSTGGNGNRIIGNTALNATAIPAPVEGQENVTFWSHLQAADLLSVGTKNVVDPTFGEAQPENPIGSGYRIADSATSFSACPSVMARTVLVLTSNVSAALGWNGTTSCAASNAIDRKIDDETPSNGTFRSMWGCESSGSALCNATYVTSGNGTSIYDLKGF